MWPPFSRTWLRRCKLLFIMYQYYTALYMRVCSSSLVWLHFDVYCFIGVCFTPVSCLRIFFFSLAVRGFQIFRLQINTTPRSNRACMTVCSIRLHVYSYIIIYHLYILFIKRNVWRSFARLVFCLPFRESLSKNCSILCNVFAEFDRQKNEVASLKYFESA